MGIIKNPYNSAKVAQIRQLLSNNAQSGKPTDYEILVDELKVVQRTNDPETFDNHEEFIDGDTRSVTIVLYDGSSRRCTKHLFMLKDTKPDEQGLSGVEINKLVSEKLEKQRGEWQFEQLVKEKQKVEEELKEAEEIIEGLQADLEEARSKRKMSDMQWGEIGSVIVEGIIRRNPSILSNIPGVGESLAGVFKESPSIPEQGNKEKETPETVMTFREKEKSLSETDKQKIAFVNQIEAAFTESELEKLAEIIQLLTARKPALDTILQFLKKPQNSTTHSAQTNQETKEEESSAKRDAA